MTTLSSLTSRSIRSASLALAIAAPLTALAQTAVYIDFSAPTGSLATTWTGGNWNNVTQDIGVMASPVSLIDFNTGLASGISYQITRGFGGNNGTGDLTNPRAEGDPFPFSAWRDSFFQQGVGQFSTIVFSGLQPGQEYTFTFASARGSVSDNRTTEFLVEGLGSGSVSVNSSNNTQSVSLTSVFSDANGFATLTVRAGAGNDNASRFYYINAMSITAIPEPSAFAALAGLGALGVAATRRRRRKG